MYDLDRSSPGAETVNMPAGILLASGGDTSSENGKITPLD